MVHIVHAIHYILYILCMLYCTVYILAASFWTGPQRVIGKRQLKRLYMFAIYRIHIHNTHF